MQVYFGDELICIQSRSRNIYGYDESEATFEVYVPSIAKVEKGKIISWNFNTVLLIRQLYLYHWCERLSKETIPRENVLENLSLWYNSQAPRPQFETSVQVCCCVWCDNVQKCYSCCLSKRCLYSSVGSGLHSLTGHDEKCIVKLLWKDKSLPSHGIVQEVSCSKEVQEMISLWDPCLFFWAYITAQVRPGKYAIGTKVTGTPLHRLSISSGTKTYFVFLFSFPVFISYPKRLFNPEFSSLFQVEGSDLHDEV